jgi:hypothetical protein
MKLIPSVAAGGLLIALAVAAVPPTLPDPASEAVRSAAGSALDNTQGGPATMTTGGIRVSITSIALSPELLAQLEEIQAAVAAEQEALKSVHSSVPGLDDGDVLSHGPRITYKDVVEVAEIPFGTVETNDADSLVGNRTVITAGVVGSKKVTWTVTYSDGEESGRAVTSEVVVTQPSDEVVAVGTKAPPPPPPAVPAGEAQEIAKAMLVGRGWDDAQFSCLVALWNRESGWRTTAGRTDGPYGIPQANPGTKMASAGADWQTNAATQITWGLNYIAGRYGNPCGAWAHFQSDGWY